VTIDWYAFNAPTYFLGVGHHRGRRFHVSGVGTPGGMAATLRPQDGGRPIRAELPPVLGTDGLARTLGALADALLSETEAAA
jgi:hypothetical protein